MINNLINNEHIIYFNQPIQIAIRFELPQDPLNVRSSQKNKYFQEQSRQRFIIEINEGLTLSKINKKKMKKLSHVTILDEYAVDMDVVLGQGSTGCVYQGLHMKTGNKVAIKVVDLCTIDNEVASYLLTMQKTALMIVNNPYVLQGLKVAQDSRYCFMITEFCNGGTLKKQIRNSPNGYLSQDKAMNILYYLLLGYEKLVEKGIVHRDLKPANIMLHNSKPKIIDFGYCQIKGFSKPLLEYNVGSPSYMAPQSFQSNIYNQKTQIWAIGVILYQCLVGKTFDDGRHMSEVYQQIQISGIPYPSHVSYHARNIINWCLNKNPKNRPTCSQLIMTYFTNRNRTKSNISPSNMLNEVRTESDYFSYNQNQKYLPTKEVKTFKEVNANKIHNSKTEEMLLKAAKAENRLKQYKVPDFLQNHKKIREEKQNDYRSKTYFNNDKFVQCKTTRPITKLSCKTANQDVKSRDKSNKKEGLFNYNWEYGNLGPTRNYSKVFEPRKKIDVQAMYDKICKSTNLLVKNRILSNHENLSPNRKYEKSPTVPYRSTFSKQYAERTKRTITERANPIRA